MERVAVLRALPGLGDMLCLVPALESLKAGGAQVALIGLGSSAAWFADRYSMLVDDVIVAATPAIPEATARAAVVAGFFDACRKRRFDLVVQCHGEGPRSNEVALDLGGADNGVRLRTGARSARCPWPPTIARSTA